MPLSTKTILIADDDDEILDILSRRCSLMELRVVIARSGFDALMEIRTRMPDIACLDINMPAGDGLSVCQMLMNDQDSIQLPVIILTGRKDEQTVRRCQELTAQHVPKGDGMWERIEPLIYEMLKLPKPTGQLKAVVCDHALPLESDLSHIAFD